MSKESEPKIENFIDLSEENTADIQGKSYAGAVAHLKNAKAFYSSYYKDDGLQAMWEHETKDMQNVPPMYILGNESNDPQIRNLYSTLPNHDNQSFEAHLATAKAGKKTALELYAINIGNRHWTCLALDHKANGKLGYAYIDSDGVGQEKLPDEYLSAIESAYGKGNVEHVTANHDGQQNTNSCALHAVLNMVTVTNSYGKKKELTRTSLQGKLGEDHGKHAIEQMQARRDAHAAADGAFANYQQAKLANLQVDRDSFTEATRDSEASTTEKAELIHQLYTICSHFDTTALNKAIDNQSGESTEKATVKELLSSESRFKDADINGITAILSDSNVDDAINRVFFPNGENREQALVAFVKSVSREANQYIESFIDQGEGTAKEYDAILAQGNIGKAFFHHAFQQANNELEPLAYTGLGIEAEFVAGKGFKVLAIKEGSALIGTVQAGDFITHYTDKEGKQHKITKEEDYKAIRQSALEGGKISLQIDREGEVVETIPVKGIDCKVFGGAQGDGLFSFEKAARARDQQKATEQGGNLRENGLTTGESDEGKFQLRILTQTKNASNSR